MLLRGKEILLSLCSSAVNNVMGKLGLAIEKFVNFPVRDPHLTLCSLYTRVVQIVGDHEDKVIRYIYPGEPIKSHDCVQQLDQDLFFWLAVLVLVPSYLATLQLCCYTSFLSSQSRFHIDFLKNLPPFNRNTVTLTARLMT